MKFEKLLGETLVKIDITKDDPHGGQDKITFYATDGSKYRLTHHQDCCESVYIESIVGDLLDLINTPLTLAEEVVNLEDYNDGNDSSTWTFYKLATVKGYVDIRWCGTSNGYYSESVDFEQIA